jgi:hypothetical protein
MSDNTLATNMVTDTTGDNLENLASATKTYTQEEFDRHMAGMKSAIAKKYEKQLNTYSELGDIEQLRELKLEAEKRQTEQHVKRGEFEKVLQDLAQKKDLEIQKRDSVIKEYKVNTPLLSAAANMRAVAPEQVKALLNNNVRLNGEGEVEVVDNKGAVRYNDKGAPLSVEDLVKEFLSSNPHFVQPAPATTNTRSSHLPSDYANVDLSKLDMKNPEHRKIYANARKGR